MSFLKTLPILSAKDDIFASLSYLVYTLIHFSSMEEMKERIEAREGKIDGERGGQICVTCLKQCLKFGNSSSFPPLFFSLHLSHLHRNVQLALIREAEGKSNWARDQKLPYGDRLGPATLLTQRQATKAVSEYVNESVCIFVMVSL